MWPWEHLAFGYVFYSLWRRVTGRPPPTDATALLVVFGTQFPDLVDKPLAWSFGVLPSGRSLTHSLITATLIITVVLFVASRRDRLVWGTAFAAGYYSHLLGDAIPILFSGWLYALSFLLWPVLPVFGTDSGGILEHLAAFEPTPLVIGQILLLSLPAVALWLADGAPGTALFQWVKRLTTRERS